MTADLVEEQLQRVGRDVGECGVVDGRGRRLLAPAVVPQGDPARIEVLVEAAEIVLLEVERLDELVDLAELQAAAFLPAVDQRGKGATERILSPSSSHFLVTGYTNQ